VDLESAEEEKRDAYAGRAREVQPGAVAPGDLGDEAGANALAEGLGLEGRGG